MVGCYWLAWVRVSIPPLSRWWLDLVYSVVAMQHLSMLCRGFLSSTLDTYS